MQWKTWTGTAVAIAAMSMVGVMAQSPATTQTPSSPATAQQPSTSGSASSSMSRPITITGCLEKGSQMASSATTPSATGTTGTRGSEAAAYTLRESSPTAGATSTPGSASASASASMAKSYALDGHESDLSSKVDHQIEVTGTVEAATSGTQHLRVESVKEVASSCSPK
jgi:hypothetical protein